MRIPEFFIIGAPKCGTTAIYTYLRSRPDVFMPSLKEPHYFSFDFQERRAVFNERDYLELFRDAPETTIAGEASASYLFSEVAVEEILRINPSARMIAILRNPIDAAYSFYSERVFNLSEDAVNFQEAWDLQEKRLGGSSISKFCREPKLLQYRRVFSFAKQIENFFRLMPEEQRLVCLFEDYRNNPRQVYLTILDFLGLPDDGRLDFPATNASKVRRSRRLAEWQRTHRSNPTGWFMKVDHIGRAIGFRPSKLISRFNVKRQARSRLDPDFRSRLAKEFMPDVRKLEVLLERRLDCWRDFHEDLAAPVVKAS